MLIKSKYLFTSVTVSVFIYLNSHASKIQSVHERNSQFYKKNSEIRQNIKELEDVGLLLIINAQSQLIFHPDLFGKKIIELEDQFGNYKQIDLDELEIFTMSDERMSYIIC